jgi:RNA polymerase sigma factor (sigma-70 family)
MFVGPDFEAVLVAAQGGADWAFDRLYRAMNPRLVRYLRSYAPGAADDLASETWLGAARNLSRFSGDEDGFRAWLFKIGHRRLVEHWRTKSRTTSPPTDPGVLQSYLSPTSPEDQVVEADSALRAAQSVIAILSHDQAQVILLRVLAGLSVEQVAGVLGKSPGSVRVLQHKGLRRLAKHNFSPEAVTERRPASITSADAPPLSRRRNR